MSRRHGKPGRTTPRVDRRVLEALAQESAERGGCTCADLDLSTVVDRHGLLHLRIAHDGNCPQLARHRRKRN